MCPVYQEDGIARAKELQAQLPLVNVRAVFCGTLRPPEPKLLLRTVKAMVRSGRRLLNPLKPQTIELRDDTVLPYYAFNPLPQKLIIALHEESLKGIDLFQAEFAEMLPLGSWFLKGIPKLFVHHQIHFVYAERLTQMRGESSYSQYLKSVMRTQEEAYLQNYQGVIVFSEQDRQALLPFVASERLFTSPFPIPADVGMADGIPEKFCGRFLFVASEEHFPNQDALEWLVENIWPEILRELPMARLTVIGRWSEFARNKYAASGLTFSGFVSDLSSAMRGGIMLVPLRIGSGIRVKIMAAMAQGVPVISTTVGSEGMPVTDGVDVLVRDEPFKFAAAAVQLAQDSKFWMQLAIAGKNSVAKHYSPEQVRQRRNVVYSAVLQNARISR